MSGESYRTPPGADGATGSFQLRMRVGDAVTKGLRPGMFIRVRIRTEGLRDALMVPKAAVLAEGDQSVVYAVRNGIACKVKLDPGLEERLHIECRNRGDDGLQVSDVVVTGGHQDLRDQARVELAQD